MEDIIDDIASLVEDIRTEIDYAESEVFLDIIRSDCNKTDSKLCKLSDSVAESEVFLDVIRSDCNKIDSKLCKLSDSVAEFEEDDFRSMIPENISAGEAISLKETINNWRREHGYGEL